MLYDAWEYVDKTNTDADGYRIVCRALFLCQLTLALLITVLSAKSLGSLGCESESDDEYIENPTLLVTLLLSAVVSIDSLISPKLMWKQLRLASAELESLIWRYRAGVGEFDPGLDTLRDAEDNFDAAFTRWKKNLQNTLNNSGGTLLPQKSGGHLHTSALPKCLTSNKRKWTSSIVKHNGDNNYSYVLSNDYLRMRLDELLNTYQNRLPKHVWLQRKWQLMIIVLGIVIAWVSELEYKERAFVVLILTALISAVSSWSGFVDLQSDAQLYPRAITTLRNIKMEWEKRIKHQQQDLELFEDLVFSVENVALNVVESWSNCLSEANNRVPIQGTRAKFQNKVDQSTNSGPSGVRGPDMV